MSERFSMGETTPWMLSNGQWINYEPFPETACTYYVLFRPVAKGPAAWYRVVQDGVGNPDKRTSPIKKEDLPSDLLLTLVILEISYERDH